MLLVFDEKPMLSAAITNVNYARADIIQQMEEAVKKVLLTVLSVGLFSLLAASQAFCLSVTDMTLNGNDADAAYGYFSGNDDLSSVQGVVGSDFDYLAKYNIGGSAVTGSELGGLTFSVTPTAGTSGNYTLNWTGTLQYVPSDYDFAFVLKGATTWALYTFDDVSIASSPGYLNGTYEITFTNNGGNFPDLSHMSVYGRVDPGNAVPEPATMLLFGTGLASLAGLRRRMKK
ncbi:MAG: PEP-CTERM sorting domain-containing protein [Desulfopila sp.]